MTEIVVARTLDAPPAGDLTETITAWDPEALMVLRIDSTSMNPIGSGLVDYVTVPDNDGQSTAMRIRYAFETKWGVIGRIITPTVSKKLSDAFEDVLTDLEAAAMSERG